MGSHEATPLQRQCDNCLAWFDNCHGLSSRVHHTVSQGPPGQCNWPKKETCSITLRHKLLSILAHHTLCATKQGMTCPNKVQTHRRNSVGSLNHTEVPGSLNLSEKSRVHYCSPQTQAKTVTQTWSIFQLSTQMLPLARSKPGMARNAVRHEAR